jgi:hypothetical protein
MRSVARSSRHCGERSERSLSDSPLAQWLKWADDYVEVADPLARFRCRCETLKRYHWRYESEIEQIRKEGFRDPDPPPAWSQEKEVPLAGPLRSSATLQSRFLDRPQMLARFAPEVDGVRRPERRARVGGFTLGIPRIMRTVRRHAAR